MPQSRPCERCPCRGAEGGHPHEQAYLSFCVGQFVGRFRARGSVPGSEVSDRAGHRQDRSEGGDLRSLRGRGHVDVGVEGSRRDARVRRARGFTLQGGSRRGRAGAYWHVWRRAQGVAERGRCAGDLVAAADLLVIYDKQEQACLRSPIANFTHRKSSPWREVTAAQRVLWRPLTSSSSTTSRRRSSSEALPSRTLTRPGARQRDAPRTVAHFGDPKSIAAAPADARDLMRRTGGSFLAADKVEKIIELARDLNQGPDDFGRARDGEDSGGRDEPTPHQRQPCCKAAREDWVRTSMRFGAWER